MAFIGEVLDLRHRLPLLWASVVRCEVEEWQARKVARLTHQLSQEQAADVDRAVAWFAGSQPYWKLVDAVEANVLRVDGARAREQYEERRKQRGVWKSQTDDNGLTGIYVRLDPHVARTVYGRVQELADCMTEGTADERRAAAFGLFGDTAAITRLRAQRRQPDLFDEELAQTVAELTPDEEPDRVIEESEVHPSLRDRPTRVDVESVLFEAAVERIVAKLDPAVLVPTTTMIVHIAAEDLAQDEGVCKVPGIGPVLKSVVGDWLGHDRVIVRPVIDLNDVPPPVDDYQIPARHRTHALMRNPGSAFPWSTSTSGLDLDHTVPYQHQNSPPGQTSVEGLAPMSRYEHRTVTHGGWQRRKPDPTTMIFRTPHGNVYLTNRTGTHDLGTGPVAHALWSAARRIPRALSLSKGWAHALGSGRLQRMNRRLKQSPVADALGARSRRHTATATSVCAVGARAPPDSAPRPGRPTGASPANSAATPVLLLPWHSGRDVHATRGEDNHLDLTVRRQ